MGRTAQVLHRMQDLETVALKQLDPSPDRDRVGLDELDEVDWLGGGYSCSREVAQVVWPNWSLMNGYDGDVVQQLSEDVRISTDVESNGQHGSLQLCFVLIVLCTGRYWDRTANAQRGCGTRTRSLLFHAYSRKRCNVGRDDDSGIDSFVGRERCGGTGCLEEFVHSKVLPRVLEGARTQSSCACAARERQRTSECRKMQRDHESKGPRMVDNKGRSKRSFKCY